MSRTFDPPAEFREHALLKDPAVYEQAASDPQAWWVEQAERLHGSRSGTRAGRLRSAVLQVVHRRQAERVLQLPRPPRRGREGERVAFHWRGEDGSERDITYAELLGEVKRFASALKDLGVKQGDVVGSTCR